MKEMVKAEMLKLFNTCIIYTISDSSKVSPIQVVLKKGMTAVRCKGQEILHACKTSASKCMMYLENYALQY